VSSVASAGARLEIVVLPAPERPKNTKRAVPHRWRRAAEIPSGAREEGVQIRNAPSSNRDLLTGGPAAAVSESQSTGSHHAPRTSHRVAPPGHPLRSKSAGAVKSNFKSMPA